MALRQMTHVSCITSHDQKAQAFHLSSWKCCMSARSVASFVTAVSLHDVLGGGGELEFENGWISSELPFSLIPGLPAVGDSWALFFLRHSMPPYNTVWLPATRGPHATNHSSLSWYRLTRNSRSFCGAWKIKSLSSESEAEVSGRYFSL